jgi:CBS domain-containing protein
VPVSSICSHNVATIHADENIVEAAVRMREAHVGDLIVAESREGRVVPIGIVTDRDIVISVIASNRSPAETRVRDVMSREIVTVHETNGVEHALGDMRRAGVRRAPVVNARDELIGVLSIDDAIDHVARQLDHIAGAIRLEQDIEPAKRP